MFYWNADAWKSLLDSIGNRLSEENLTKLMELCEILERPREKILRSPSPYTTLFYELEKNDQLIEGDCETLKSYLRGMERHELVAFVYDPIEIAIDYMCENNLGDDWREISRGLGLKGADLDDVKAKHQDNHFRHCLNLWRVRAKEKDPAKLTTDTLIGALRDGSKNKTADNLSRHLQQFEEPISNHF
jgi:hypothetical protein